MEGIAKDCISVNYVLVKIMSFSITTTCLRALRVFIVKSTVVLEITLNKMEDDMASLACSHVSYSSAKSSTRQTISTI